jgi:hypothetical protein
VHAAGQRDLYLALPQTSELISSCI